MKTGAELGMQCLQQQGASSWKEQVSKNPLQREDCGPADNLVLDFWPVEQGEGKLVLTHPVCGANTESKPSEALMPTLLSPAKGTKLHCMKPGLPACSQLCHPGPRLLLYPQC